MTDPVRTMRAMRASAPDPASLTSQSVPIPDPGPVGGATTARSWAVLRSGGTLVAIAEEPEPDPGSGGSGHRDDVRSVYFVVRPDGTQLRELARLIDDGQFRPVVSAVFWLGELADAFLAKRGDRPPGKVVISIREDIR
jgi:NADPH:quinone reductase-like Zn-dependent oxidoreductase